MQTISDDGSRTCLRQDAQRRWHELEPGPLTDIDDWLRPYRKVHPGYVSRFGPGAATIGPPA